MATTARVKEGSAVQPCPKGYKKVTVVVQSAADDAPIKGAQVTLHKAAEKKAAKEGGSCTLPTNAEGQAVFSVKEGTFALEATAEGKSERQDPKRPFEPGKKESWKVSADETVTIKLTPIPICAVQLQLKYKDPADEERALLVPGAKLKFSDESEVE